MIKLNPALVKSGLKETENLLNSSLKPNIVKYKKLSNKLSKSKSGFATEFSEALVAEAEMYEDTAEIYTAIIAYLNKAVDGLEALDHRILRF